MTFIKTTEQASNYDHLEKMTVNELLGHINKEDQCVPIAVEKALPQIKALVAQIVNKLKNAGRLFYIGAGTSGRLGILDASECPPTFGVAPEMVIGIIAGGDLAIRNAVEFAEDSTTQGWLDLQFHKITAKDVVIGLAASGTTPYVVSALEACNQHDIITGCVTCNQDSPLAKTSNFPIEVIVGPEFVSGSSRMKAGTAQKLVLNMISTSVMIQLGRVKGNRMVDMQLSNTKLVERAVTMLMQELNIEKEEAQTLIKRHKNVRTALMNYKDGRDK
ncbi:N-acetylmuramic acid 6-phosphate etherase [Subsaximicrobium wynnwilliamsii]|uniref:N-acetylmuramic acid 6-phosphate etherase n=1 Tax=Subsaximicrobium wynnwilliamsii TaxID=291179 RepID=A0A5C6ZHV9_9FLAO|nr:N-acetylmuramic acid 6-phosphate etherase [Subsaximicrobium wynnwilliamsii]TXD83017.1 N-acetylmuramic acid 6-phosphate etherase [Subsaximicrobium wynnwilliamsii]TXD88761.1 N-acetylmuramic acid 6-phosphate etherase [Subsaximicrobium wynnwilliamsii]TXE02834.1 N-acetylmuramic acid 6-phosphate etherase [Subsaximicrobium wynnwilliamsii]